MMFTVDELETKINQLKTELIQIAARNGLNNCQTISCSQQLDKLITLHQKKVDHSYMKVK